MQTLICHLENAGLWAEITFSSNRYVNTSYILRVYRTSDIERANSNPELGYEQPIYTMSFGNGVSAEDRLLELLEHPAWTMLKYG